MTGCAWSGSTRRRAPRGTRCGSTSPTTPSSSTTAPRSCPTRSRTRRSSRSPTPRGKIIWSYGHPARAGTAPGFLHEPDDADLLRNGQVTVADANNLPVLVINEYHTAAHRSAPTACACTTCRPRWGHRTGTPAPVREPARLGDQRPWVSESTLAGKRSWTVELPIAYPSDPQQIGPDKYSIADYAAPGEILEFNRAGRIRTGTTRRPAGSATTRR